MTDILKPSGKAILLGNQAVARGALEAGLGFASAYPGTPSTEIGETFSKIAKKTGIYFEYSTNEKVAAEAAAGAAFSGVKSLVCFKNFGFNVASDSIYPLAYHGVEAGMVIVCADDPGCHSSGQSEEDSRYFARVAHMPLLEPADPQECKDFVKIAFEISEKIKIPVILRTTTRVSHASGIVELNVIPKLKTQGAFKKGNALRTMPPKILQVHKELDDKLESIKNYEKINKIIAGKGKIGIIASGVSYHYALEAMKMLGLELPVLKLGMTWPVPDKIIEKFIKNLKSVVVIEELEPIIEKEVLAIAKKANPKLIVHGKNHLPGVCELRQEIVAEALAKITKKKFKINHANNLNLKIPRRIPTLCPGCPHRSTFWAAKQTISKETPMCGDIGCYMIGILPPNNVFDSMICMGAGSGIAHGIKKATKQKAVSFIGDGTFFHSGISPLINEVYNDSDNLTIILDNRWTAMTGHQPNAGTGINAEGDSAKTISTENIAKGCGVENIEVANCYNINETKEKINLLMKKPGKKVLVAKGECRLQFMKNAKKRGINVPIYKINEDKCTKCGKCLYEFGCPAIQKNAKGNYFIDPVLCLGCAGCMQICPAAAISIKEFRK